MKIDLYWLQARLYPALLTVMPTIAVVLTFLPNLFDPGLSKWIVTVLSAFGVLYAMASFARSQGKRVEKYLLKQWGGWPSSIWIRHRSKYLSPSTLARYHGYLMLNVPGLHLPTLKEEEKNPSASDEFYDSAVEWLKEKARGNALVEKEVTEYGFRRNLLGMRRVGITLSIVTLIAALVCMQCEIGWSSYQKPYLSVENFNLLKPFLWTIAGLIFNLTAIVTWVCVVTTRWVRESADQYARALLAVCDSECTAIRS